VQPSTPSILTGRRASPGEPTFVTTSASIDLRSDTVTRPTAAMLAAMQSATVGDDVFGEDPTVNELQRKAASLFGMEAALFCPSGTMTNQIAIKVHTQPGDEVLCDRLSHVYLYEGGGIAVNSGCSVRLLEGQHGRFTAEQVEQNINKREDAHFPLSRLVSVENTVNKGGGGCWSLAELTTIRATCHRHGLAFHLDGARLFNALIAKGESPAQYGALFDTISICLSKGLGAPVGSLLLGSREYIRRAHRIRKVFGGGMRQAGFLAAAGIHALDHHVERLAEDHRKAARLGVELEASAAVAELAPIETNIVIAKLIPGVSTDRFLAALADRGILALSIGPQLIRFVFHLDVSDNQFDQVLGAVRAFR
jgi:threonine aldolase